MAKGKESASPSCCLAPVLWGILLASLSLSFEDGNLLHIPHSQAVRKGGLEPLCIIPVFPEQVSPPVFHDSIYTGWRVMVEAGVRGGGGRSYSVEMAPLRRPQGNGQVDC